MDLREVLKILGQDADELLDREVGTEPVRTLEQSWPGLSLAIDRGVADIQIRIIVPDADECSVDESED